MSKIMSMLEKLNVVEKVNEEKIDSKASNQKEIVGNGSGNDSDVAEANIKQQIKTSEKEPVVKDSPKIVHATDKFEKNQTIDEIYKIYNMKNEQINTVFMLGNFLNALPESLPYDVRKSTVLNIISAANADLNQLVSDGEKRLTILNEFTNEYYNSVNSSIAEYNTEIVKLKKMIDSYEDQIQKKQIILNEQNHIIKYETQRINNIISFFDNEKI